MSVPAAASTEDPLGVAAPVGEHEDPVERRDDPGTNYALNGLLGAALLGVIDRSRAEDRERSRAPARGVQVLDCGGGSGSLAVPLAVRGCRVTVVDTSIDALATLERRAREAAVAGRVLAVQGDIENLGEVVAPRSMDLVLLHGVLVGGGDAGRLFAAAAGAVRPGGVLSVVVANAAAVVLARAMSGAFAAALDELTGPDEPLTLRGLAALAQRADFDVLLQQGVGAFSSTVPGGVLSTEPRAGELLDRLDRIAATQGPYRDIAGQLHLLARRREGAGPGHGA